MSPAKFSVIISLIAIWFASLAKANPEHIFAVGPWSDPVVSAQDEYGYVLLMSSREYAWYKSGKKQADCREFRFGPPSPSGLEIAEVRNKIISLECDFITLREGWIIDPALTGGEIVKKAPMEEVSKKLTEGGLPGFWYNESRVEENKNLVKKRVDQKSKKNASHSFNRDVGFSK